MPPADRPVSITVLHEEGPYDRLAEDIRDGLARRPPEIPPKYFYDARGGELFERITHQEEYYPTRVEIGLLDRHAQEIAAQSQPTELLEIGSGSPRKAARLLPALGNTPTFQRYVPFDINRRAIEAGADWLHQRWPDLPVDGVIGDFTCHFEEIPRRGRRLVAFLGGTIGNFRPAEQQDFLGRVREALEPEDHLLLGTDLRPGPVKTVERLEAAYDDSAGVTAAFNLNLLSVLRRELDADLDSGDFAHRAVWVEPFSRIEMHLVARRDIHCDIPAAEATLGLAAGEHVLTEVSHKFSRPQVRELLSLVDLELEAWFEDDEELFALSLARAA